MNGEDSHRWQLAVEAYEEYVALFWRCYRLSHDDPRRTPLAQVVSRADARWRAMVCQCVSPPWGADPGLDSFMMTGAEG